jgi:hypothetical protein
MGGTALVAHLDIVEGFGLRAMMPAMPTLMLQAVEEAVRRRVVPAVPLATRRADRPVLLEPRRKDEACIRAAAIRVRDRTRPSEAMSAVVRGSIGPPVTSRPNASTQWRSLRSPRLRSHDTVTTPRPS